MLFLVLRGLFTCLCDFQFYTLFSNFLISSFRQNPKDIHTLAQLISAYSLVDPEKAKAYPFDVVVNNYPVGHENSAHSCFHWAWNQRNLLTSKVQSKNLCSVSLENVVIDTAFDPERGSGEGNNSVYSSKFRFSSQGNRGC